MNEDNPNGITIKQKQVLTVLPEVLIITLKRFTIDYSTTLPLKINDYFEFPFDIDLSLWSR